MEQRWLDPYSPLRPLSIVTLACCHRVLPELDAPFLDAVREKLVTAPFVAETTCRDPAAPQSRVALR